MTPMLIPSSPLSELPAPHPELSATDPETTLTWLESQLHHETGQLLSDLQRVILRICLAGKKEGKKYLDIAEAYGCTEGHAKDVGAQLWRSLSQTLGEKVTKHNLHTAVARCRRRARQKAQSLKSRFSSSPLHPPLPSQAVEACTGLDPAAPQIYRWSWDDHRTSNPVTGNLQC